MSGDGWDYQLYGFRLRTDRQLPGLPSLPTEGIPDITVTLRGNGLDTMPVPASAWLPQPPFPVWKAARPEGAYLRLRYSGGGHHMEFVLGPGGRRVWAWWSDGLALEDLAAVLLGPVLTCLVRLSGKTCLHGSVVAVNGRALVILGASGAGKSTTALACIRHGATLVSDDLAILDELTDGFSVRYGQPALRLRPSAAEVLGGGFDELRPIWSNVEPVNPKRYLDFAEPPGARPAALPVEAIIVLGPRLPETALPAFEALPAVAVLATLMANRSAAFVLDREQHAGDFAVLSRLASRVPVRQLARPEGLDRMNELGETLLAGVFAPS